MKKHDCVRVIDHKGGSDIVNCTESIDGRFMLQLVDSCGSWYSKTVSAYVAYCPLCGEKCEVETL